MTPITNNNDSHDGITVRRRRRSLALGIPLAALMIWYAGSEIALRAGDTSETTEAIIGVWEWSGSVDVWQYQFQSDGSYTVTILDSMRYASEIFEEGEWNVKGRQISMSTSDEDYNTWFVKFSDDAQELAVVERSYWDEEDHFTLIRKR